MGSKKISQLTENTNPSLSGVTIFDDGISSYKVSLQTLKDTIVEETTNYFTGSQVISGSLNVLNSVTASFFVGNGSQLTNLPFSVSGSGSHMAFFHTSTHITSSNDFHLVNGNETLALGTDSYTLSNPERLMVDNGGINIATFQAAGFNNYSQLNIKNFSSGSNASSDLTLWNDVSTENSTYVNLGINSSTNAGNTVGFAGDGYLFNDKNDMYIGSNYSHVHLFSAGQYKFPVVSIFSDRSIGFNVNLFDTGSIETIPSSVDDFLYEFSGSVKLNNDFKVDGFTILAEVSSSLNFADDSSAAAGGVPLGGLYRTDNVIKIRLV